MEIRALRVSDRRDEFTSGNLELDRFFRLFAAQNQFRHHIGTTYVAAEDRTIFGYATVAAAQLEAEHVPPALRKKLPGYPLPVLRLARLAVDERKQGAGIGKRLLRHVFYIAIDMAERIGCVGVVVDSKPEAAKFYEELGFVALELVSGELEARPRTQPMFLPLELIVKAQEG